MPVSGNKIFTKNFILHLSQTLSEHPIEILVPSAINPEEFHFNKNCNIKIIESTQTEPEYLSTLLWENQQVYDYALDQDPKNTIFLSTHHSLPLEKLPYSEFIILHDIYLWKNPEESDLEKKIACTISKKSVENAEVIFTVSDFTKKEINNFFPFKIPTIPIYEDINQYFKDEHLDQIEAISEKFQVKNKDYFLYIGSFKNRKNIPNLFKAYSEYLEQSKFKKKLIIIGFNQDHNQKLQHKLPNNVLHYDTASLHEIYQLYKHAYAFLYPSIYEGFGLEIIEAQNINCPVLASDIDIFHEVGGNGILYFDSNDSKDIASKMLEIENNATLRHQLIKLGRDNCRRYSWANTINKFVEVFSKYL